jgi:nucleotide-binding universal stress UspA family protein
MYKNILLPVDLNEESSWKKALPTAVEYCHAFGAALHVMTVIPDYRKGIVAQYFPADFEKKAREETDKQLQALIKKLVPQALSTQQHVTRGSIYDQIVQTAKRINADLIVMASHRPGAQDYLIGPNATRVIRHFGGSVLVVRD